MAAALQENLTVEIARELSDAELRDLAAGEDERAAVAADVLAERERQQYGAPEPADNEPGEEPDPADDPDARAAAPEPDVDEILLDGTAQLSMFNLGGKLPTGSTLALTGGKVDLVQGQAFSKGDRVRLTIEAVVNEVGQKDAHDPKTGQVVSCEQRHKARIVDMQLDSRV